MEQNIQKPRDIVDTTDSLEAVGACRSMKNFLFIVILICLLLTQILFWVDRLGLIAQKTCPSSPGGKPSTPMEEPAAPVTDEDEQISLASLSDAIVPLAAEVNVAEEVKKVTAQNEPADQPQEAAADDGVVVEDQQQQPQQQAETPEAAAEKSAEAPAEPTQPAPEKEQKVEVERFFRISGNVARVIVVICNFLILTAAVLYSLTLLICLKISLTGRLGGLNHIARAFFISLFLLVVLIPWQRLIPGVLVGTVWLPGELFCGGWDKAGDSNLWKVLFYLRFCGLWLVALWFLLWSQNRSARWARATLRRLGVVR